MVNATPFALEQHRPIPFQAQPAQIALDRLDGTGAVTRRIEVIYAQQPGTTGLTGRQPREQSRLQVAQVENPRGGWGKTAAVATGGSQGSTPLQMLLQMLWNSLHLEQPSCETAIKKGDPLGRPENEVDALISPERGP